MFLELFAYLVAFALIAGTLWLGIPYFSWRKVKNREEEEKIWIISSSNKKSLEQYEKQRKQCNLSLVVPSYNEQERLPIMLKETAQYLKPNKYDYEIIVVNDGSVDSTTEVALKVSTELGLNTVVVEYPKNRGKGGAVRAGVSVANGRYILMLDADGATKFSDLAKLQFKIRQIERENRDSLVFVVGSRRVQQQEGKVQRKIHRRFVSFVFKTLIGVVLGIKTKDTQCGFKLFTKDTAKVLFKAMHVNRFAFDVELFFLALKLRVITAQVGVQWHDVEGSKLGVLDASLNMLRDLLIIRIYYLLGLWRQSDSYLVK